ncbi:MAG: leucine-rich repeat domain-containing protein [Clostridia bacterium]|nr:leucine-rich repeat domain-containing protein [Clostridia bacterium]
MKRLLSAILVILMLIPMAFTVDAANVAQGSCGEGMTWTLDDMGTLSIHGSGIMDNFGLWNEPGWYPYRKDIKQVIIYDALVIGMHAFRDCTNMTKATVVGSNLAIIGNEAFWGCDNLSQIHFGNTVQYVGSSVLTGTAYRANPANWVDGMLYVNNILFEIDYYKSGALNVRPGTQVIADYAADFYNCQVTSINIPSSVKNIGDNAFHNCTAVTEINIAEGVQTIGEYAFDNAAITSLTIPNSVTTIESWAFSDSKNLADIHIGSGVTSLGKTAFSGTAYFDNDSNWDNGMLYCGDYMLYERSSWGYDDFVIKDGIRVLSDSSFSDSTGLTSVQIPDTVTVFGNRSFDNVPNLTIKCYEGSLAKAYAEMRDIPYEIVCKHQFGEYVYDNNATCYYNGTKSATCSLCGEKKTVEAEGTVLGHNYGEWWVEKEPTYTETGLMLRRCDRCAGCEEKEIPMLEMPVVKEPYLSSYGVQLTVHDLYDIKDYFIAEGDHNTYREVKNNLVVSIGAAKLGTRTEYTYTLPHHGMHTVYIRYNDGSYKILKTEITGAEPEYTVNGLQLTVSNLDDIKVIRTAYGEFNFVSAMKKDATHRAFTAKNDIKGSDSYKIQYRNNGPVTVAVCYNDGYTEFYTYNVEQKTPTMEQNGATVTFGNLDGLYNIRYAKGEYTTSSEIKKAPGSVALKASAIDENGNITVVLSTGTYTFCVQYDDESYNYYTVTVDKVIVEDVENPEGWQ